jgi:ABC-type branched-subunit amino acid transport system ATPase component
MTTLAKANPVLELRNVSKHFNGVEVTRDVSFAVAPGSRVALIGPNGAGKTTLFNLISGVYRLDAGEIFVDGVRIDVLPSSRRIDCGLARNFQNVRLMRHLTVAENLFLGQTARRRGLGALFNPFTFSGFHPDRRDVIKVLEAAGLAEYAEASVEALPYGLRKRVDLARALLARPRLLLLDEPAAGLNPAETIELLDSLHKVAATGTTLVIVEHDMHFVRRLCDHVIVLNFGRKVTEGDIAFVEQHPEVREAYLGTDVRESCDAVA